MKELKDESIDAIITDPPYNILTSKDIKTKKTTVIREAKFDKPILKITELMKEYERILKDGGTFLIFCSDRQLHEYIDYCQNSESLRYSNTLVWVDKLGHPSVRKRAFSNASEYIAFGHKKIIQSYTFNWLGEPKMRNVLNFNGCTSFEYGKAKNGSVGESVWGIQHKNQPN